MVGDHKTLNTESYVEVHFKPDPGIELHFDGLKAHEELGRPFLVELDLSSGEIQGDIATLLGSSGTVWLAQSTPEEGDEGNTYLNGIVTRVVSHGLLAGSYRYRVEMRPWIWLLTRITDCRIFQNKSAFEIVTQVFRDAHFSEFEDKRQGGAGDTQLEYCVQYRETSFNFVTRLMEQYGFYYFFVHEDGKHTLMLADDPNAHTALTQEIPYQFDQTEYRTVKDHFWEWETDLGLQSGKFTFQDYNFTTPAVDLTAKTVQAATHTYGDLEVYEYPGPYQVADVGQRLTDVRMQAIVADRVVYRGNSNSRKLHAGWRFTLSKHPDKAANREYLITQSQLTVAAAEGMSSTKDKGETIDTYRALTHAIPGKTHFRLHRTTPRPLIRGPQTARVVGRSGEEITTDEYGRIKVRFHWDRSDTEDDQRTCWIRVAQTWAGAGWGSLYIPRVGQEVVVEFLEGNPDRPLVTGVVYNANQKVPYTLPDNKTRTVLKTNSSSGNGFNELRFEDKGGEEEVFFQAQKDYTRKVLHDEKVTITNNTTTTVESGNHSLDVSAGTSSITAAQSITLTVAGNSIKIDTSGITINGMKLDLTGSAGMTANGGPSMSLTAGMISIN